MAKIKSTIDLIMEKTRHLALNEEEKDALAQQELEQRVQGLVVPYLKGERDAEYLAHELDRFPPETNKQARGLCLRLLMGRLSPFQDNGRILAAVERLSGGTERTRWEQVVAPLEVRYRQDAQKAREEAAVRCREALASAGLAGPALLPRVDEEDPVWKEAREAAARAFHTRVKTALEHSQM